MDTSQYLTKAAEKIDQWEKQLRAEGQKYNRGLTPRDAERIARAWIELAAIERGVTPTPANPEES